MHQNARKIKDNTKTKNFIDLILKNDAYACMIQGTLSWENKIKILKNYELLSYELNMQPFNRGKRDTAIILSLGRSVGYKNSSVLLPIINSYDDYDANRGHYIET